MEPISSASEYTTPASSASGTPAGSFSADDRAGGRAGLALLGLLFLLFYGRYMIGFAPSGGDIVNQYLPYQELVRGALRQGAMPYWNAFTFCGRPLMADIQVGVLYPPNWLHWILPLPLSFALLLALHGAWMLAGCWRLARHFRLAPAAAALGTILFAASPFFTLKASQGIVLFIYVGAWWPWVLLATARLVERPGFGRLCVLALTLALSLLAGSPQITYYGWLAACALAVMMPTGEGEGVKIRPLQGRESSGAVTPGCANTLHPGLLKLDPSGVPRRGCDRDPGLREYAPPGATEKLDPSGVLDHSAKVLDDSAGVLDAGAGVPSDSTGIPDAGRNEVMRAGGAGQAGRRKLVVLGWLAGAFALAFGLTAIQTAQTAGFIGSSFERGGAGGAGWDYVTDGSLLPRLFWLLTNPGLLGVGHSEGALYFGSQLDFAEACFYAPLWVVALLLPLGVAAWKWNKDDEDGRGKRRLLVLGALAMALGLALAPGADSPLFKLFYYVFPGFNRFRVPARLMIFFFAGEALVAALALDALLRNAADKKGVRLALLLGALAALAAVWVPFALRTALWNEIGGGAPGFFIQRGRVASPEFYGPVSAHAGRMALMVTVGIVGALAALMKLATARPARALAWALPALAAAELVILAWPFQKTTYFTQYDKAFYQRTELVQALQKEHRGGRVLWLDDVISWLVDQNQPEIYPNKLLMYGLPDARGYDPVNARWIGTWMNLLAGLPPEQNPRGFMFVPQIARPAWLPLMGVETVVSYQDLAALPGLKAVWQKAMPEERTGRMRTLTVWRNERFAGMAFAAPMPKVAKDDISAMMLSARLAANPATSASQAIFVNAEMFAEGAPALAAKVDGRFKVKALEGAGTGSPNSYRYEVEYPEAALLCLAQSAYGGWNVTVDGETGQLGSLSGAFLAAAIPAGRHEVVFDFLPDGLATGRMITLAAIVAMMYGLGRGWWMRKRSR